MMKGFKWGKRISLWLLMLLLLTGAMETASASVAVMASNQAGGVEVALQTQQAGKTRVVGSAATPKSSVKITPRPTVKPAPKPTAKPAARPRATVKPTPVRTKAPTPTPKPTPPPADAPDAKFIALTFDDGPNEEFTAQLLDVLEGYEVPATFFVLGCQVEGNEALLLRMVEQGHQIGNHTLKHKQLSKLSKADIRRQIAGAADLIEAACGQRPQCVRPPYGDFDKKVKAVAQEEGDALILWSIDPEDWRTRDTPLITQHVLDNAQPGGIILMHDIYPHAPEAAEQIILGLWQRGYTFVTVQDLLGNVQAGKAYGRASKAAQR